MPAAGRSTSRYWCGGFKTRRSGAPACYEIESLLTRELDAWFKSSDTVAFYWCCETLARSHIESIAAVRKAVGKDFTLGVRMCADEMIPGGITLEDAKQIAKALEAIRNLLEKVVKEKRIEEPDPSDAVEGAEGEAAGAAAGGPGGAIRARDQALAQLAQVADYFRRTEPHSPVSYLVQRAITWGQMPLDAWLGDVIKDNNVLAGLRETLGLKGGESLITGPNRALRDLKGGEAVRVEKGKKKDTDKADSKA